MNETNDELNDESNDDSGSSYHPSDSSSGILNNEKN